RLKLPLPAASLHGLLPRKHHQVIGVPGDHQFIPVIAVHIPRLDEADQPAVIAQWHGFVPSWRPTVEKQFLPAGDDGKIPKSRSVQIQDRKSTRLNSSHV